MTKDKEKFNARAEAFKSAILNTCRRKASDYGLDVTLEECMTHPTFRELMKTWLMAPLFREPIEDAMREARLRLLVELI